MSFVCLVRFAGSVGGTQGHRALDLGNDVFGEVRVLTRVVRTTTLNELFAPEDLVVLSTVFTLAFGRLIALVLSFSLVALLSTTFLAGRLGSRRGLGELGRFGFGKSDMLEVALGPPTSIMVVPITDAFGARCTSATGIALSFAFTSTAGRLRISTTARALALPSATFASFIALVTPSTTLSVLPSSTGSGGGSMTTSKNVGLTVTVGLLQATLQTTRHTIPEVLVGMVFITLVLTVIMGNIFLELIGLLELLYKDVGKSGLVESVAEGTGDLVPVKTERVHLLVPHPLKGGEVLDGINHLQRTVRLEEIVHHVQDLTTGEHASVLERDLFLQLDVVREG